VDETLICDALKKCPPEEGEKAENSSAMNIILSIRKLIMIEKAAL
jgi:hypothetical protein